MKNISPFMKALKHPLSLSCIALLLLNDHVFKSLWPSFLTGKLSDAAGLFFFPFLFAAALSSVVHKPRLAMSASLWLTAFAFAAIKTIPAINGPVANLMSWVLGGPVNLALDPTDLMALPALFAAWLLWQKLESPIAVTRPSRWAWAAMGAAVLATVATAPVPPAPSVSSLAVDGQTVYTMAYTAGGIKDFASQDGGLTWSEASIVPPTVKEDLLQPGSTTACHPEDKNLCYRLSGQRQVDISTDGGQTWSPDWSLPEGREQFIERFNSPGILNFGRIKPLDRLHDLEFASTMQGDSVVVAAGNEGILVKREDGTWQRLAVDGVSPTPLQASNLPEAYSVMDVDRLVGASAGVIIFILLSSVAWVVIGMVSRQRPGGKSAWWIGRPFWISLLLPLFGVLLTSPNSFSMVVLLASPLICLFCLLISWVLADSQSTYPSKAWAAAGASIVIAVASTALTWLILILWAYGVIRQLETATIIAVLGSLGLLFAGWVWVRRLAGQAVLPKEENTPPS